MIEKTAADFFAGIGLVGLGLARAGWSVRYAVDHDDRKREVYEGHFGAGHYFTKDVADVEVAEIPDVALYHASFPCTDLSVAGSRGGIRAGESSAFWDFVRLLEGTGAKRPPLVMLENVEGLLTSSGGEDVEAVLSALNRLGYAVDLLLIDAAHFVPQSRVRLFIIGVLDTDGQDELEQEAVLSLETTARPSKVSAFIRRHPAIRWNVRPLPPLPHRSTTLEDIIDPNAEWWPRERSQYLFDQMFGRHQEVIRDMMARSEWAYGTVFRRMRMRDGKRRSTAELRTDGIAGCLRTPKGGSARQIVVRAGRGHYDARLLNAVECARLMGVDDYYMRPGLPLNQALFGFGDAVCVPVITWIATHYLNPAIEEHTAQVALATELAG